MKTIGFEGFSDDNFGPDGDSYDNCAQNKPIKWLVKASDGELIVIGHYHIAPDAVWTIGVCQRFEGSPIPNWPVRIMNGDREYSCRLEVDLPDDAVILCLEDRD